MKVYFVCNTLVVISIVLFVNRYLAESSGFIA